jgi:predicted aminopeptidase
MVSTIDKKSVLKYLLLSTMLMLQACSSVSYYAQSVVGHATIMLAREPVDKVIKTADDSLKKKLIIAKEIKKFSVAELSLPDNKSYTSYVELKNSSPVWNVVAAKELSLMPKQWCYLVIGCASYRGYYSKQAADDYAKKLKARGYDVMVAGVGAYSTLGFFADPLTSAMFDRDDATLAELIFHELSHQKIYIKNNTRFNEAFATVVGEQGALLWLQKTQRNMLLNSYKARLLVQLDFINLVVNTKNELESLYKSSLPDKIKRQKKQMIFELMRSEYEELKTIKWNGKAWYKHWFAKPLNNARLVSVVTYYDLVPSFVKLFEACDKDFSRFYKQVAVNSKTKNKIINSICAI